MISLRWYMCHFVRFVTQWFIAYLSISLFLFRNMFPDNLIVASYNGVGSFTTFSKDVLAVKFLFVFFIIIFYIFFLLRCCYITS